MNRKKKVIWQGETECDFCHNECEDTLYDAKTTLGPWAIMCEDCFAKYGAGMTIGHLGPGIGQGYLRNPETNKFEKYMG